MISCLESCADTDAVGLLLFWASGIRYTCYGCETSFLTYRLRWSEMAVYDSLDNPYFLEICVAKSCILKSARAVIWDLVFRLLVSDMTVSDAF